MECIFSANILYSWLRERADPPTPARTVRWRTQSFGGLRCYTFIVRVDAVQRPDDAEDFGATTHRLFPRESVISTFGGLPPIEELERERGAFGDLRLRIVDGLGHIFEVLESFGAAFPPLASDSIQPSPRRRS